jgi:hypothetical protein
MNLADIYSYIDSKKRALGGLLAEPGLTIDKYVQQLREDNRDRVNLQANAYPMAGDKTVLNSPHQLDQFRKQLADEGANMALSAATVWHGSPHKFDKFDSSKIGTGEGAQAYGHGLYLAEQKSVADEYAGKLSKPIVDFFGKVPSDPMEIAIQQKLQSLAETTQTGSKLDEISKALDSYINPKLTRWDPKHPKANAYNGMAPVEGEKLERIIALRDAAKRLGRPDLGDSGSLYKVDLPDEHIAKMLDWDKPLFEQPAKIQELAKLWGATSKGTGDIFGNQFLQEAQKRFGGVEGAADALRARGIPGIRYLDGGSRGAGQGSSNFVVFPGNEGLLSILERNGQPLK